MAEGLPQVDIDLAALPLFSGLTSTELDAVTQEFEEEYAQPGERLLREGFVGTGFYVVISGDLTQRAKPHQFAAARRFVAVEDWANGGEPLPFALGAQLFEQLYRDDRSGSGDWIVDGIRVGPDAVRGPIMEFASASDAIVPLACSPDVPGREVLASGHVGMVIGGSAPTTLWPMLRQWILSHEPST